MPGSDELADSFSDLEDEYFPGSRHKRSEKRPPPEQTEPEWDASSLIRTVKGVEMEFFTISALAEALGRRPVTIRRWIREGVIPEARFRTPRAKGTRGDAGKRLWTRAQIEAIVRIAREEGVFQDDTMSRSPSFKKKVFDYFRSEGKDGR